jgi:hypothetical protein
MNETGKKVLIIVIAIIALGVAIWQGMGVVVGPSEVKKEIGHGTPGHGMKAQEKADEAAGSAGQNNAATQTKGDPLAGPV